MVRGIKLVAINLLVFVLLILGIEIAYRSASVFVKGRTFFREDRFVTPWITTYDAPQPFPGPDGAPRFRHRESPTALQKSPGTVRIIAVGGSTTANERAFKLTGIDYPMALERSITRDHGIDVPVEVLNAGSSAYSTAHSLVNIQFRLVEYAPDVILLMHNINDCTVNFFGDRAAPDYSNKYLLPYFLNPGLQGTRSIAGFLTQSRFLSRLELPKILANRDKNISIDNDYHPGLHYFRRNLISIAEICEANDILLVLMTQPHSLAPHPFMSQQAFDAYNEEILDTALDHDIVAIDMYTEFGHDLENFVDEVHYSPQGIERFANLLSQHLRPMLVPPTTSYLATETSGPISPPPPSNE
jgi:lysophospholipase L1-like esterase